MKIGIIGSGATAELAANFFTELGINVVTVENVKRIHKRFLSTEEILPQHSRMEDLFRLVFAITPQFNEEEEKSLLQQLGEVHFDYLLRPVENYIDVDAVLDLRPLVSLRAGPSGNYALGEEFISSMEIFYSPVKPSILDSINNISTVLIVGSGFFAMKYLNSLWEKIAGKITVVTTDIYFLQQLKSEDWPFKNSLLEKLAKDEGQYQDSLLHYQYKMYAYRDLEEYEKVKILPPEIPEKKISIIEGANCMSIDKLADQSGVFVTVEVFPQRFKELSGGINKENFGQLKTIRADNLICATGFQGIFKHHEPGYFAREGAYVTIHYLEGILKELTPYFTQVKSI